MKKTLSINILRAELPIARTEPSLGRVYQRLQTFTDGTIILRTQKNDIIRI